MAKERKNIIAFVIMVITTFTTQISLQAQSRNNIQEVAVNTAVNTTIINGFRSNAANYEIVNLPQDKRTNVIKINGANCEWDILSYSLGNYKGKQISIRFSADVMRVGSNGMLNWLVNNQPNYPSIAVVANAESGVWYNMNGTLTLIPTDNNPILNLSTWENNSKTAFFYFNNLSITIEPITIDTTLPALSAKWPFPLGVAVPVEATQENNLQRQLLRHYNVLGAENALKPANIMPNPWTPNGAYRWSDTDRLVNYAEANNKKIRGHLLFWHDQTPEAFFMGSGKNGLATIDELYSRMENHAKTVFQKYRGRIEWWDVVNETVSDNGNGPRPGGAPQPGSRYTQIMEAAGKKGMDRYEWIVKAFQFARQYADANGGQNVKLFLTDCDVEYSGDKHNGYIKLLDYLIANNVPIDGAGIQGHYKYDFPNVRDISKGIDVITARKNPRNGQNLIVQICELDISLYKNSETNWNDLSKNATTIPEREINTRLTLQAKMYRELFDMFEQKYKEGKLGMVMLWDVADGNSWLNWVPVIRTNYPLLFDRNYQPKPAYNELIRGR